MLDDECKPILRSVATASAPPPTAQESAHPSSSADSPAVPLYMMEDDKVDVRLLPSHTFLTGGDKITYASEVCMAGIFQSELVRHPSLTAIQVELLVLDM